MTPQGRAIKQAAVDFGNGQTLPFTPCKKGYIPMVDGKRKVGCPLHNLAREKRLKKEQGRCRKGEMNPNIFWSELENSKPSTSPKNCKLKGVEDVLVSKSKKAKAGS